jgi:mRNA interferase HigB
MHIISLKAVRSFWAIHTDAEQPMRKWHGIDEKTDFVSFIHLRETFSSADYVRPYTIFNAGGNNYRIITVVRYRDHKIFIRWVLTHREYDEWCGIYRKRKA